MDRPNFGDKVRNAHCNLLMPETLRTSTIYWPLAIVNQFEGSIARRCGGTHAASKV